MKEGEEEEDTGWWETVAYRSLIPMISHRVSYKLGPRFWDIETALLMKINFFHDPVPEDTEPWVGCQEAEVPLLTRPVYLFRGSLFLSLEDISFTSQIKGFRY